MRITWLEGLVLVDDDGEDGGEKGNVPSPPGYSSNAVHLEDSRGEEAGYSCCEDLSEVEK